jgi:hypothetical protein
MPPHMSGIDDAIARILPPPCATMSCTPGELGTQATRIRAVKFGLLAGAGVLAYLFLRKPKGGRYRSATRVRTAIARSR